MSNRMIPALLRSVTFRSSSCGVGLLLLLPPPLLLPPSTATAASVATASSTSPPPAEAQVHGSGQAGGCSNNGPVEL